MEQNSNEFVSKFDVSGNVVYAKVVWKENIHDLFRIKIYDDGTTWTGRYSRDFATLFRQRIGEAEEEYDQNIKNALSGDQTLYTYHLTMVQGDDKSSTFQWRKKYEDGAEMVLGSVPVHRTDTPESKDELINCLLLQNKDFRSTIEGLQRKNEHIVGELDRCKLELEKFVNLKTTLETSLYGKFVQLLNAKKRRIQLLEENLLKFEEPDKSSCDNELD